MSPAFQAKAWALRDAKLAEQRKHREKFGDVLPVIHTEAWGKRLVGVGNRIYAIDPKASCSEFLVDYVRGIVGEQWWQEELAKHVMGRHLIAQWQDHAERLMRDVMPDEQGRYWIPRDGPTTAYLTLAYDLHTIQQNVPYQERIVERLRQQDGFVGFRYELLVAATFARAGFLIEPEDEGDGSRRHPEFVAKHRDTGFVVAVEAKARNRRPSDRTPSRAGIDHLLDDAATKVPEDVPYAVFVEVAMPPEERNRPPSWADEVDQSVKEVVSKHRGERGPFDWVFFTSIPHQFGAPGAPDPPRHWLGWLPRDTRIPPDIQGAVVNAMTQYGNVPDDFNNA